MGRIIKLLDVVGRLSDFDEEYTIYVAKPWTEDSDAMVAAETEGKLVPAEDRLKAMGPKLQAIYGGDGQWDDAIAQAMHMPEGMPEAIPDIWLKNQKIARDHNVTLTPQQFAEMFVDNNFAD